MSDGHVFLSYRSTESEFALKLAFDLRAAGIPLWMDQLEGIKTGDDWVLALQNGLDQAKGMIVVLSPAYVNSKYCKRELQRADAHGYPILPTLIEPVADIPLELQRVQHLNFVSWRDESFYQSQLPKLIAHLQEKITFGASLPLATTPLPAEQSLAQLRKLEDDIAGAAEKAVSHMSNTSTAAARASARKAERLNERLEIVNKQYRAALDQFNSMLDAASRVLLERQVDKFEMEITEIEIELEKLGA